MKDIYIEFKNSAIKGDVRDSVHGSNAATGQNAKPTIEVDSWAHLIRQPKSASSSSAGGHTSERCEHDEMVFVKDIDSASPKLWQAASQGLVTPEVEITFYRSSGQTGSFNSGTKNDRVKYLVIKLKNVLISSVAPGVSEEGIPKETFGLKYSAVDWAYSASKLDGSQGSVTGTGAWNLATNTSNFA
jgi:type VI secretion system secreted protein Hcp